MAVNSLNDAMGAIIGIVAGLVIIMFFSIITTVTALLLICLRKSPKTTILSVILGAITFFIGNALQLQWFVFIGIMLGIVIGRLKFKPDKISLFQTKTYLWIVRIVCAITAMISLSLINTIITHAQNSMGLAIIPIVPLMISLYGLAWVR